ncbi:MAG: Hpt domain-containing protein [Candidatus Levybacteria bacterium]|nr:Hpt domain-containing protein [Candidatus Levybacteria bacterium]
MGSINLSDYKEIYFETAREYVKNLFKSSAELEKDFSNIDALKQLHISAHSLRSQSHVMNYMKIAGFAQSIESSARNLLANDIELDKRTFDSIKINVNNLNSAFTEIEKEET